jgi:hypothetical protein
MAEEWRDIRGYEGVYQVSDAGRVRRIRERYDSIKDVVGIDRVLKPKVAGRGYSAVCFTWNGKRAYHYIHRLVAEAFIDNPQQLREVNHRNADKTDNRAANLEWMTSSDNHNHAADMGLAYRGHLNGSAKLTKEQVLLSRQLNRQGVSRRSLAERFGVSYGSMSDAIAGRQWAWL